MKYFLLITTFIGSNFSSTCQTEPQQLSVFIDCERCDQNFIKQELTYLTYVRDRLLADVHIQIVNQSTGSGGEEYTFFFYGQDDLAGNDDTLSVITDVNNTFDEVRRKQLKVIQIGLAKYMLKKGFGEQLDLHVYSTDTNQVVEKDPWNYWVFNIRTNGWFNGEEQTRSMNLNGGIDIDRVTEDWKIELGYWMNYRRGEYYLVDDTIVSEQRSIWANAGAVKSINNHWSLGLKTSGYSSIVDNYKINSSITPAIEYNIFPYEESTKRQIRIAYKAGARYNEYNELTVYNKTDELLFFEELGVTARFQEKWGAISGSVNGSHYFHNIAINRVNFNVRLDLRLFKGFNFNIGGNLSLIHDQISLAAIGATPEEILLSQQQLQTGYRYWGNVGVSYTFGSIYNSVVNPRFGNF